MEKRELLAGDILFAHNYLNPADVNDDMQITASDALRVINSISRSNSGGIEVTEAGQVDGYMDVNGDGFVTASDALSVINAVSRGEAASAGVELFLNLRDENDVALTTNSDRTATVNTDDVFYLEVSYSDLRTFGTGIGAFQVVADILVDQADVLTPIVTDTDEINIESTLRQATGGSATFSLNGVTGTVDKTLAELGNLDDAIKDAVVQLGGYDADTIVVTPLQGEPLGRFPEQAATTGSSDSNFQFRIRYNDFDLANQDLPDLVVDFSGLEGATVRTEVVSTSPLNADGSIRGSAVGLNLDTRSRTAPAASPFGRNIYNSLTLGTYVADTGNGGSLFDNFLAVGPLSGSGIEGAVPGFEQPFDTFSIPLRVSSAVTDLNFSLALAGGGDDFLLYGEVGDEAILTDNQIEFPPVTSAVSLTVIDPNVGTNNDPVITVGATDDATQSLTETDAGLTASGTLTVTDTDTADTVSASVVSVTSTGPEGTLDNAALLAMLSLGTNPVVDGSSTTGSINYSFDSGTEAFNFLASGESLALTYTIRATDSATASGTDDQTVVVTIAGTDEVIVNNAPVISVGATDDATQGLTETDAGLMASGTLTATDADTADTVSASVVSVTSTGPAGTLDNATLLAMLSLGTNPVVDGSSTTGSISYTFDSGTEAFDFLDSGESLALTYTIRATDSGTPSGTDDQTVVVTISGTNEAGINNPPVISIGTGDSAAQSLTETDAGLAASGTLTATDLDTTDTVSASIVSVMAAGPTGTLDNATFLAMLSLGTNPVVDGSSTTGAINYSFSSGTEAFDFLDAGESLALTYTIRATDSATTSGTDDQTVVVTIAGTAEAGTNNAPVISVGTGDSATQNLTETDAGLSASGTLTVTDSDTADTVSASVVSVTSTGPAGTLDNATLLAMLSLGTNPVVSGTSTTGSISYSFNSGSEAFNFLASGESLALTYTIRATDSASPSGTDDQTVVVTIAGTDEAIINNPVISGDVSVIATEDTSTAFSAAALLANSSPGTGEATTQTLTVSNLGSASEGGTVSINSGGGVDYVPASNFFGTETFTFTISDNGSPVSTGTVTATISVASVNDAPVASNDSASATRGNPTTINVLANDNAGPAGENQALTVVAATSDQGNVAINSNGTLTFTSNSTFTGNATIDYTIQDSDGAQDSAVVTVAVTDFVPVTLSGSIFIDNIESTSNPVRDGIQNGHDAGIGGIQVRLVSSTGTTVASAISAINGTYSFTDVAPGNYTVVYDLPETIRSIGSTSFPVVVDANSSTPPAIPSPSVAGTQNTGLETIGLLASSYLRRNGGVAGMSNGGLEGGAVSFDASGNQQMFIAGEGFDDVVFGEVILSSFGDSAVMVIVREGATSPEVATIDSEFFVQSSGGQSIQFFGGVDDFDFTAVDGESGSVDLARYQAAIDRALSEL